MASPPHKMSKLSHDLARGSPTLAGSASKLSLNAAPAPPPESGKKRLGLSSGVDKHGVKKLTLRSKPRASTSTPPDLINHAVATLTRAVRAIQARPPQPTPESLQALYTLCEAAVASGATNSQLLYDRIRMEIERQAGEIRKALATMTTDGSASKGHEEKWLSEFQLEGQRFLDQMLLVRSIFLQLDRTYVLQSPGLLSIWDLGLDIFHHSVLGDEQVSNRVTASLLILIEMERNGDEISRTLLRSFLGLLRTISSQSYSSLFVEPFLRATKTFYTQEGNSCIVDLEPSAYLGQIVKRIKEEGDRCEDMVGTELTSSVLRAVEDEMIRGHVEGIAEKETADMCSEDEKDNLATLYSLLGRVDQVDVLRKAFLEHLKASGLNLIQDKTQDDKMVTNLIAFRKTAIAFVDTSFSQDNDFREAVNDSFKFFINKRENKPAEMMAKYLDAKLRSGKIDDAEMEQVLNDVLYLFRFTQGKDIFEAFYKRDLAKRLLLNKSASFDAERSMLLKLKDECGAGFTQKLEVMFKDMELSSDFMRAYSSKRRASNGSSGKSSASGFDLSVAVISQGNWPTYPAFPIALPAQLSAALETFKQFYVSKHSGRTLAWNHGLDTCSLKAQFPKGGKKELLVSLGQAVVLLLFNDQPEGDKLSVEEIADATKLDAKELSRTLQSLACGKVRVLSKHPKGREVNPGDQFSFNTDFKDDHIRIKINQIQQKETAEENKSTTDRVFTDRSSHLQLAIVRIMKARKTLKHSELVMEVVSQIGQRFKVDPSEIKKSISSLIDREYLRRAEGQLNVYEYLA
ncbi:cullin family protein [Sporobolomyces koalae]|uniref:cullin family protein n=1 Tax=Sporobolomyces koalae TaxID=500713 RepID=UPI0031765459